VDLDVKGPQQDVLVAFQQVEGVREAVRLEGPPGSVPRYRVQSELGIEIRADLASSVINSGWELLRLDGVIMSLEEIFLRLTTEDELIQQVDSTQEDASAE
jgi:ABC-2 type transport system ATP-binding protein